MRLILPALALLLAPLTAGCDGAPPAPAEAAGAVAGFGADPEPTAGNGTVSRGDGTVSRGEDSDPMGDGAIEQAAAGPDLGLAVDAWPFSVAATQLDGAAVTADDVLYVAAQRAAERPLIDPALLRVTAHVADDDAGVVAWQGAVLGPSPMAVSASGDRVLAVWSQRAHPGRELALVVLGRGADAPHHRTLAPDDGAAFEPVDRPIVAPARDGGWLVCTRDGRWVPRCARVDRQGHAASWRAIRGMKSYPPWKLVPSGAEGYLLFGGTCAVERCRAPRVVAQALSGAGTPRGKLRFIARLEARRGLGVVPIDGGALLFGRRRGAKHGMAMIVRRTGVEELAGRYTRSLGAVATQEGALFAEVDALHMEGGHPVRTVSPRRWRRAEAVHDRRLGRKRDGRLDAAAWPGDVARDLPTSLDQQVLSEQGLLVAFDLPKHGAIRGVALRPGAVEPPTQREAVDAE